MISEQFDDRVHDPNESSPQRYDDAQLATRLRDPRLRVLIRTAVGLSGESQELLVAVADRLRVVEHLAHGATAELY